MFTLPLQLVPTIVHSDVCGPIISSTSWNKKYFLTFIDDFTHSTIIYLSENKSQTIGTYTGTQHCRYRH